MNQIILYSWGLKYSKGTQLSFFVLLRFNVYFSKSENTSSAASINKSHNSFQILSIILFNGQGFWVLFWFSKPPPSLTIRELPESHVR